MNKSLGFVIPLKEDENRRALVPETLAAFNRASELGRYIYLEHNYGKPLGYSDNDYRRYGIGFLGHEEIYEECDIIIDPKIGSTIDNNMLKPNQTGFGWFHAVQGREITEICLDRKLTAIAWEDMYKDNRHVFWENNVIAGKAALLDFMRLFGRTFDNLEVAVIGRGNTAQGALDILNKFSAHIHLINKNMVGYLKKNINSFDIIVNCVLWDPLRKDRILYREDISRMKKGSAIIDVSCNHQLEIETSIPTSIADPVYIDEGVFHYAVDHTPSLLYKEASESISNALIEYLPFLVDGSFNEILEKATIIKDGEIIDNRITEFQNLIYA